MGDLRAALEEDLTTIKKHWNEMLDLPRAPSSDKVDTSNNSPTPIAISVLSMRFDATHTLAAITHRVWDERRLKERLNILDVPQMCRFLTTHADWVTTHGPVTETADEISTIAAGITELIEQTKARRTVIADCPDCAGQLIAFMRPNDALLPSEVRCSVTKDHVWTPWEWTFLGRRIRSRARLDETAARRLATAIVSQ